MEWDLTTILATAGAAASALSAAGWRVLTWTRAQFKEEREAFQESLGNTVSAFERTLTEIAEQHEEQIQTRDAEIKAERDKRLEETQQHITTLNDLSNKLMRHPSLKPPPPADGKTPSS